MLKKLTDYSVGQEMDLPVLIKLAQVRQTRAGKPYLAMTLADSSGEIRANFWQVTQQDIASFTSGKIVELNGKHEEYHGQAQVNVYGLRLVGQDEGLRVSDFVKSTKLTPEELEAGINEKVFAILNPTWNRIVRYLLKKWHRRFFDYPAGKHNHHALRGGLALHTLTMLKDAEGLCAVYPQVDSSLLYAGCILHDMGKVLELSGPAATQYTVEGNLVGHLVLIDEQIVLAANELKIKPESEDLLLLRHMVLSHHGQFEYGSPKRPALLEAELLHRIDDLDAMVNAVSSALTSVEPGHFTAPIQAQDGRRFYRPKHDEAIKNFEQ